MAENNNAMEQAAKTNDVEEIKKLFKKNKNTVHKEGVWKWTPLMRAADNNCFEACKYLIEECGAKVDHVDEWGHTSLHIAATKGFERICEYLLKKGANVDYKDRMGRTPLMLASHNGHLGTADVLLRNRASLDIRSDEKLTAVDMAKKGGRKEMYMKLIFTKSHGVCPTRSGVTNDCSKCTCGECRADTQSTENRLSSLETQMQQINVNPDESRELQNLQNEPRSPMSPASAVTDASVPQSPALTDSSASTVFTHSSSSGSMESGVSGNVSGTSGYASGQGHVSVQSPASSQGHSGMQSVQSHGSMQGFVPVQRPPAQQVGGLQNQQQFVPQPMYPQHPMQPQQGPIHPYYQGQPAPMYYQQYPQGAVSPPAAACAQPPVAQAVHLAKNVDSDDPLDHIGNAELDDPLLRGIAEKIGKKQMELAIQLGIPETKVANTNANNQNNQADATFILLSAWKNGLEFSVQRSNRKIFSLLFDALKNIERNDIIVHVVNTVIRKQQQ